MPRYFFSVYDGFAHEDIVGTELPNLVAAKRHAAAIATELLAPEATEVWEGDLWFIEGTDEAGKLLFTISLSAGNHTAHRKLHGH